MQIDDIEFHFFRNFLKDSSGYHLTDDKRYLLESRLEDVLRSWKLNDHRAIISSIRNDYSSKMATDVIEAMTINETFFFRDQIPFDVFENQLLDRLAESAVANRVRIWSAACSTGQEPYSVAMIATEKRSVYPKLLCDVVGTDINSRVLSRARQGVFSDIEVHRGLPDHYRDKYFTRDGSNWKINDDIRAQVHFRQMNLKGDYDVEGPFDFVLLRNVLIYFDTALKENILRRIADRMRPGGYLLLGAAEGIYDLNHHFQRCSDIKGLYEYRG